MELTTWLHVMSFEDAILELKNIHKENMGFIELTDRDAM